ncbi:hypothetical protein [Pelolinea submarina]|uniref:Uncharacterized protein n=1 Tax=Pelolinea submarina TaxID=913107 RepID=A0A347ZRV5_9CHLR|nr:hypothetical protein [Pelolinea submarina]REG11410.1 hypothetical protein DFR64_1291 [Pelolinea submarina]BBB48036.1 hypothetical protein Pelsub_P1264 [Pelolinea submarina]
MKYWDFGKIFFKSDKGSASDWTLLSSSEPQPDKNYVKSIEANILRFPDASSSDFCLNNSKTKPSFSIALLDGNQGNSFYLFLIQRRREGEFNPNARTNRPFNQYRIYELSTQEIIDGYKSDPFFFTNLIDEFRTGELYRLPDYFKDTIHTNEKLMVRSKHNLESETREIGTQILNLYYSYFKKHSGKSTPSLHIISSVDSIYKKIMIIDFLEFHIFPIYGVTSFALDFITERKIDLRLYNQLHEKSNLLKIDSTFETERLKSIPADGEYFSQISKLGNCSHLDAKLNQYIQDTNNLNLAINLYQILEQDISFENEALFSSIKALLAKSNKKDGSKILLKRMIEKLSYESCINLLKDIQFSDIEKYQFTEILLANFSDDLEKVINIILQFLSEKTSNADLETKAISKLDKYVKKYTEQDSNLRTLSNEIHLGLLKVYLLYGTSEKTTPESPTRTNIAKMLVKSIKQDATFELVELLKVNNLDLPFKQLVFETNTDWSFSAIYDFLSISRSLYKSDYLELLLHFLKIIIRINKYVNEIKTDLKKFKYLFMQYKTSGIKSQDEDNRNNSPALLVFSDQVDLKYYLSLNKFIFEICSDGHDDQVQFIEWWFFAEVAYAKDNPETPQKNSIRYDQISEIINWFQDKNDKLYYAITEEFRYLMSYGKLESDLCLYDACAHYNGDTLSDDTNIGLFLDMVKIWQNKQIILLPEDINRTIDLLPASYGILENVRKSIANGERKTEIDKINFEKWLGGTSEKRNAKLPIADIDKLYDTVCDLKELSPRLAWYLMTEEDATFDIHQDHKEYKTFCKSIFEKTVNKNDEIVERLTLFLEIISQIPENIWIQVQCVMSVRYMTEIIKKVVEMEVDNKFSISEINDQQLQVICAIALSISPNSLATIFSNFVRAKISFESDNSIFIHGLHKHTIEMLGTVSNKFGFQTEFNQILAKKNKIYEKLKINIEKNENRIQKPKIKIMKKEIIDYPLSDEGNQKSDN